MESLRAGERASRFTDLLTGVAGACLGPHAGSASPPREDVNLGRQVMYARWQILSCRRKWKEETVACRLCYIVSCQLSELQCQWLLHLGRGDFFFFFF